MQTHSSTALNFLLSNLPHVTLAVKVTYFESQTCMKTDEEIIKNRLKFLP